MITSVCLSKKSTKHFMISETLITSKILGQRPGIYFTKWSFIQRGTLTDILKVRLLGDTMASLVVTRNL